MPDTPRRKPLPTVSRTTEDTLIELVYDPGKRETALVVSRFGGLWNIEQSVQIAGDVLVPYSSRNSLIANACVLLPSRPVEYGTKQELLEDIRGFLHRHVDLTPAFELVASYYVLLSWVHDAFAELGYLRLRGDYGSGKTRGLLTIGSLCYKPFFASGASTVSPLFHTMDAFGGTLVLDEADLSFTDARAHFVKILNNGTVRGIPVLRTMQNRDKEFDPRAFKVFGPKIVAMRGSFDDPALESRFLTEETGLRPLRADIDLTLPPAFGQEALSLRNRLLHFRLCHFFDIRVDPSALIGGVEPRLNQTAIALLSLVDEPSERHEIQDMLRAEHATAVAERGETLEARLVAALQQAFSHTPARASIRDVATFFNRGYTNGNVSPKWIGTTIRKRLRLRTHKSNGIYVVPASEQPKVDLLAAKLELEPTSSV